MGQFATAPSCANSLFQPSARHSLSEAIQHVGVAFLAIVREKALAIFALVVAVDIALPATRVALILGVAVVVCFTALHPLRT